MKEAQKVTLQKLGEIIELGADKAVVAALTETVKNIDDNITSLGAAEECSELAAGEFLGLEGRTNDGDNRWVARGRVDGDVHEHLARAMEVEPNERLAVLYPA